MPEMRTKIGLDVLFFGPLMLQIIEKQKYSFLITEGCGVPPRHCFLVHPSSSIVCIAVDSFSFYVSFSFA
jgi:hypothetical protein